MDKKLEALIGAPIRASLFFDNGKPVSFFGILRVAEDDHIWIDGFGKNKNGAEMAYQGFMPGMDGPTRIPRDNCVMVITELDLLSLKPLSIPDQNQMGGPSDAGQI